MRLAEQTISQPRGEELAAGSDTALSEVPTMTARVTDPLLPGSYVYGWLKPAYADCREALSRSNAALRA